jgi:hypothetical protein
MAVTVPDQMKMTSYNVVIPELDGDPIMQNMTIIEMTVSDSLLAPSTQTTIKVNDSTHTPIIKNLDKFAGKKVYIEMRRPILKEMGFPDSLYVEQTIYRLSDRKPISDAVEKYNLHACDQSLLNNSARRVSKSWGCDQPSKVVSDVLSNCLEVPRFDIENVGPNRPYTAENIHPLQVIAQQADVALYGGNDPCFIHYMTCLNGGTHHFRSLKSLSEQQPTEIQKFMYAEQGGNELYANPASILMYQFPCDFDVLSDIENGLNIDGTENVSFLAINPFNYDLNLHGAGVSACGFGGAVYDSGYTNEVTGPQAGTCEVKSELYYLRRQARMSLLDHDKMALQIVVPFNPNVKSGDVIEAKFMNKYAGKLEPDYGSGNYLVTTATHTVRTNGFGISTFDCVSRGVGL